jgi:RHS repeat-associated protein
VFTYTYDAVGNRLTQTTITATTVYTYDNANRLINVGGVAQTWDNNGNLLNDGVYTYTYDTANRLTSAVQGANAYTFAYRCNGLSSDLWRVIGCESDRISQTVNSVTTNYVLDQAAGLTQVLADGTNTYLYGNGRIAQQSATSTDYFLGDGLGSVRQLANASGSVTLARSYEPYGSVLSSAGTGTTSYGFTGEWTDSHIKLLYLRARWYSGDTGRFTTRDVWPPDYTRPMTFDAWLYGYANPINLTDPSGQVPCDMLPIEDQIEAGCISPPDVRLTQQGEIYLGKPRRYGGAQVKELYDKMRASTCGWWNAETDGQLTFEEFNGLWVIVEGSGREVPMTWVARAAAQNLFVGGWNYPYCPGGVGSCFNGAFNFWAAYSESVQKRGIVRFVEKDEAIENYSGFGYEWPAHPKGAIAVAYMDKADKYGRLMLYPTTLDPDRDHGPSNWGNNEPSLTLMRNTYHVTRGPDASQIYYFLPPSFLVYSVDQWAYWSKFPGVFK